MKSVAENLSWVSNQMEHSNVLVTAKIYAKWIPNSSEQVSEAFEVYGQHLLNIDK